MSWTRGPSAKAEQRFLSLQARILDRLEEGTDLASVLAEICLDLQRRIPAARCAAMLLKPGQTKTLDLVVAPDLPAEFRKIIAWLPVEEGWGSPAAAATEDRLVVSPDVRSDPLWTQLGPAMAAHGFLACWSIPIRGVGRWSADGGKARVHRVQGTLDLYLPSSLTPSADEIHALELASLVAGQAIDCIRAREWVHRQSYYDELTGLPNRALFVKRLDEVLARLEPQRDRLAVALLDLDHFKEINDTLGFPVGNAVLKAVAERLERRRRPDDLLARFGEDEFACLLRGLRQDSDVRELSEAILQTLGQPYDFGGQELLVTASLGASLFPWDGADSQTLLRNAEKALFSAKQGRHRYQLYTPLMSVSDFEALQLKTSLNRALENRELVVLYQAKVDADSGLIRGAEALTYWEHPVLGRISPGRFISVAEEIGLVAAIGAWTFRTACQQVQAWRESGFGDLTMSVNVSAVWFREKRFIETLAHTLERCGIYPGCLELEITESAAMTEVARTMETLKQLRGLGLRISIDDFGTGYSSLAYLKRFPIHTLKIDRSFVAGLPDDPESVSIARAVIALARSLSLTVVAEGVETVEQADFLAKEGCHLLQGFLFSRPVSAEAFTSLLKERARPEISRPSR